MNDFPATNGSTLAIRYSSSGPSHCTSKQSSRKQAVLRRAASIPTCVNLARVGKSTTGAGGLVFPATRIVPSATAYASPGLNCCTPIAPPKASENAACSINPPPRVKKFTGSNVFDGAGGLTSRRQIQPRRQRNGRRRAKLLHVNLIRESKWNAGVQRNFHLASTRAAPARFPPARGGLLPGDNRALEGKSKLVAGTKPLHHVNNPGEGNWITGVVEWVPSSQRAG